MEHTFSLRQDGMIVAEVSGPDRERCLSEILHYAMVYGQDGPCEIVGVSPEDWSAIKARAEATD